MTVSSVRAVARLTVLLVITAQLADLASFGMVARAVSPAGELGPLGAVYVAGGFLPVAAAKLLGLLGVLCIFTLYTRLVGSPRRLALLVAGVGIFGATTNLVGIVGAGGLGRIAIPGL